MGAHGRKGTPTNDCDAEQRSIADGRRVPLAHEPQGPRQGEQESKGRAAATESRRDPDPDRDQADNENRHGDSRSVPQGDGPGEPGAHRPEGEETDRSRFHRTILTSRDDLRLGACT